MTLKVFPLIYRHVVKKLIDEDKNDLIIFLIEDVFSCTKSLNFINENTNLKHFTSILIHAMSYSLETGKINIYDRLFEFFKLLTQMLSKIPKGFSNSLIYYAFLFNELKEKYNKKMEEFIEYIFEETNRIIDDSKFIEFKFYCLSEVSTECSEKIRKKINYYNINVLLDIIEMKDNYKGYIFFPDLKEQIKDNRYNIEEVNKVCDNIKKLLDKSIICNNKIFFSIIVKILNECLNSLEMNHKEIQVQLFSIYISYIYQTQRLDDRSFFDILFMQLEEEIKELDDRKIVSKDFAKYIIESIIECAKYSEREDRHVVIAVIDLLRSLMKENEEISFINKEVETKKELYKGLYNIGTYCIENDFEQGVRLVSNTMGWLIIYNLRKESGSHVNYLIERAKELYNISKKLEVTLKTQIFLLTLFTTVGTFCCRDNQNNLYLNKILDFIVNENIEKINVAIKLRTEENDMWKDLFSNQTEQLTQKFLRELEKRRKIAQ